MFQKANNIFLASDWRGPIVFACHWSGWFYPNHWSNFANSWLDIELPDSVPQDAFSVNLVGMFVGGVLPNHPSFMMHLDFWDPKSTQPLPTGDDWTAQGGQGDLYYDFTTENARAPIGGFWVPCKDHKIKLRWKIHDDYTNAWGINLWCQGYAT